MESGSVELILVGPYPPPAGGMAHHTEALFRLARAEGIGAVVLDINKNEAKGVVPVSGRTDLFTKVRGSDAEIVHVHADSFDLHYHAPAAIAAAKLSRKKTVLSIHSGDAADYYERASAFRRALIRFSLSRADAIVADNPRIADFARHAGAKGKVLVLSPFFAEAVEFEKLPGGLASFAEGSKPLFVACGNPSPVYRLGKVIGAFAAITKERPSAGLVITRTDADDEAGWAKLQERVKEPGLEGRVRIESGLSHGQFLALLRRADAFVRFTTHDGDSLSVREALSAGTCTIASDTGTRPDGVVLVESGDERSLAEAMSSAQRPIEPTSPEDVREEFVRLYGELLGK